MTNKIRNLQFAIRNLAWFFFAVLLAVVVIQRSAFLGLAIAITGGIVFGILITREVKA
ncbi:MAG: hypothetical protein HY868_23640 [Chloroflexi bacterium]|nr:hypothetical protein [Chloroflexota bacterium]